MKAVERETEPVVCIVDDDESIRKALKRLVASLGMRSETFASPEELLGRGPGGRVACLLLDIRLPGMDGFELRQRTLAEGLDAPVIFITAHPDERTRARAAEAEAVGFLEKPFDDRALLDALELALRDVGDFPNDR